MPMVSAFLFHEQHAGTSEQIDYAHLKMEMRSLLKNKFHQKVLTGILLELRLDLSGSSLSKLFALYQDLGMHRFAYSKLRSWRWEKVSHGILELTKMQVAESYGFLTKFINDKRPTIRKQAEIAVVTLKPEGLDYFLDTTRYKISEWQQLKLLEVIRTQEDYLPPSFKGWLTSKNKYVVLFSLRLIKHFHQNDATASIIELVKHRNNQIKLEAIDCIRTFHMTLALETLKTIFWRCTAVVKIAILQAIGSLGTIDEIEFLKLIEKKEANFTVRSKALSAINLISPESVLPTEGILDTSSYKIPEDLHPKEIKEMPHEKLFEEQEVEETTTPMDTVQSISASLPLNDSIQEGSAIESEIDPEPKTNTETPKLNEIEVFFNEEILDREPGLAFERPLTVPDKTKDIEFTMDFLPLVVSDAKELISSGKSVAELPVVFEELKWESPAAEDKEAKKPFRFGLMEEALNFIPLVVGDSDTEDHESTAAKLENNEIDKLGLLDIDLDYEIVRTDMEKGIPKEEESFLLLEVEYEEIQVLPEERDIPKAITEFEVDYENILPVPRDMMNELDTEAEMSFIGETIDAQELPPWLLKELENVPSSDMAPEYLEDLEANFAPPKSVADFQKLLTPIPARKIYHKDIEAQMHLLEDIELFGDTREIDLLKELHLKAKHDIVRVRIERLLKRFSEPITDYADADRDQPELGYSLPSFSIFSELFLHCDTESKLILLKEIASVGDEKEVAFLKKLSQDPESQIREQAATALLKLEALLEDKKNMWETKTEVESAAINMGSDDYEIDPLINAIEVHFNQSLNIFDIGFDLALEEETPLVKEQKNDKEDDQIGSLWRSIKEFSQKLITKS